LTLKPWSSRVKTDTNSAKGHYEVTKNVTRRYNTSTWSF